VEVGAWMGVLFRDGTDKRCEGNIVIFFAAILAESVLNSRI